MLRHYTRSSSQNDPGNERTDYRVADTYPGACHAEQITELPCVSDKNYRAEITRSVSKRRKPRSDAAAAQNETVYAFCLSSILYSDENHRRKKHAQHTLHKYYSARTSRRARRKIHLSFTLLLSFSVT